MDPEMLGNTSFGVWLQELATDCLRELVSEDNLDRM